MRIKFLKKKIHSHQRGMVLLLVLTMIVVLVAIVQQMAFNTSLEFKNGASHFHGLKAYYSAKSGLELTLLKVFIYKKAQEFLTKKEKELGNNPSIQAMAGYVQSQMHLLWKPPVVWPPILPEDLSEIKKNEVQKIVQDSFFKTAEYKISVENESSKLNINDLAHPHSSIRIWTENILTNLLFHLRNQEPWLSHKYSEQDLKDLIEKLKKHLNPSIPAYSEDHPPLNRRLMSLDELLNIENFRPELLEFLSPYITVYSSGGLYLQFAKKRLIQSLSPNINEDQAEKVFQQLNLENNEESLFISNLTQAYSLFESENLDFKEEYQSKDLPSLGELVFNFNAPQNFQIKAQGFSGGISRTILAIVHDPYHSIERVFTLMDKWKAHSGYKPPTRRPTREELMSHKLNIYSHSTPFIIKWKDIN